jgi:2-oxo-4-hydroxy-4-carboxy--5-ureidoimidazoline (OHCU) decarboxylase
MVTRRKRCSECDCRFTPSPRARSTQRVCGATCRAARDRKLARLRRRRDLAGYRADDRVRQQDSRDRQTEAGKAHADGPRHAPASAPKPSESFEEVARFVHRAVEASRATLMRDLSRNWPRLLQLAAEGGDTSRASFGGQVVDLPGRSDPNLATRHA